MTWFKNLKVSVKLISGFALMAVLLGGVGWLGISSLGTANENIENIYTTQMLPALDLTTIRNNFYVQRGNMWRALADNDKKVMQAMLDDNERLTRETAKATEDISQKIEAIQGDTKGAVDAIGEISKVIHQINDISNTIASAVEEQTATTNEISRNVAEASKGTAEIAQNIASVATTAKNTSEGAGSSHKAAQELARMAGELQQMVGQFQIEGGHSETAASPVTPTKRMATSPVRAAFAPRNGNGRAHATDKAEVAVLSRR